MTREEAIKWLKDHHSIDLNTQDDEAHRMAIKALEQKPCEDAVSRTEVLKLVRFNAFHVKSQIKAIENMPSVTPQEPRKGHWIKHNTPNGTYYYDCSLCGCVAPCTETADSYLWKLSNFCPDCGAKMNKEEKEI